MGMVDLIHSELEDRENAGLGGRDAKDNGKRETSDDPWSQADRGSEEERESTGMGSLPIGVPE